MGNHFHSRATRRTKRSAHDFILAIERIIDSAETDHAASTRRACNLTARRFGFESAAVAEAVAVSFGMAASGSFGTFATTTVSDFDTFGNPTLD